MQCKDCEILKTLSNIPESIKIIPADIVIVVPTSENLKHMVAQALAHQLRLHYSDNDKIHLTSLYKCPVQRKLTKTQLRKCLPILRKELEILKPKFILVFGADVASVILQDTTKARLFNVAHYSSDFDAYIIPLYTLDMYQENTTLRANLLKSIIQVLNSPTEKPMNIELLMDEQEIIDMLTALIHSTEDKFAFDVETTDLDIWKPDAKVLTCAIAFNNKGYAFPIQVTVNEATIIDSSKIIPVLKQLMSTNKVKIGHNIKFDMNALKQILDIDVSMPIADTMIMHYTINEETRTHSLSALLGLLGLEDHKQFDLSLLQKTLPNAYLLKQLLEYNAKDALATLYLHDYLLTKMESHNKLVAKMLYNVTHVLHDIEVHGFAVDVQRLYEVKNELEQTISNIEAKLKSYDVIEKAKQELNIDDINLNSPQQIAKIFELLNLPVIQTTKTGQISTDKQTLTYLAENYNIEFAKDLLQYRELNKIMQTYVIPYLENDIIKNGRIHPTYNVTATVSGRLSCSNPNLQQIPRNALIKQIFVPDNDNHILVNIDYSQAELRVMAMLSGDEKLSKAYIEGIDVHRQTAALVYNKHIDQVTDEERQLAKMVNFAIIYGSTPQGLAKRLNRTEQEMIQFVNTWFKIYPAVKRFEHQVLITARTQKYIMTPFGRVRHLPQIDSDNAQIRARTERQAINYIIQSTAADFTLLSLIQIHKLLKGIDAYIVNTVHDSIMLSINRKLVSDLLPRIKLLMESYDFSWMRGISLKVDISIGKNWGELIELDSLDDLEGVLSQL